MFSQRNRELHKAIREGNYAKVIQCLDDGPKRERAQVLDQTNGMGSTPLTLACGFGQIRIITALLDRGAAIDKVNYSGRAPLFVSSMLNEVQTVELLLARGANIEKTNKKLLHTILKNDLSAKLKDNEEEILFGCEQGVP